MPEKFNTDRVVFGGQTRRFNTTTIMPASGTAPEKFEGQIVRFGGTTRRFA